MWSSIYISHNNHDTTAMPKVPAPLYSHAARGTLACQVAVSTDSSGHSSYVTTSTQILLPPVAPEAHPEDEHAYYPTDVNMDIDDIDNPPNSTEAENEDATIEVMPGVHAQIPAPKAKQYPNSVGFI
jgi:hypothetical protein